MGTTCQARYPMRILLIEPDERIRGSRAKMLLSEGYRISALADGDGIPLGLTSPLYDVIVVSVNRRCPISLNFCDEIGPSGPWPLIVLLANGPYAMKAPPFPAVVISAEIEAAAEEQLLTFLRSLSKEAVPSTSERAVARLCA